MSQVSSEPYAFISHSKSDKKLVGELVSHLAGAGIAAMSDAGLVAGSDWEAELTRRLEQAAAVVVVWSADAATSAWVIREATRATDLGTIIPVTVGGIGVVPEPFRSQFIIDLNGWHPGSSDHPGMQELLDELRRRVGALEEEPPDPAVDQSERPDDPVGGDPVPDPLSIRPGATDLLKLAMAVATERDDQEGVTDLDVTLAALLRPSHHELDDDELREGASYSVYRALPDPAEPRVDAALDVLGVSRDEVVKTRSSLAVTDLTGIADPSIELARRVGSSAVWSHHVIGAGLSLVLLSPELEAALGVSAPDLCRALRRAIAKRWHAENADVWDSVLGALEPEPDAVFQAEPNVARDYWTVDDHLETRPYAEAIASFIQHANTEPPLTIGVKAPWGAGKTSLMRMVQGILDPPVDVDEAPWRFPDLTWTSDATERLTAGSKDSAAPKEPVTIGETLKRTRDAPRAPVEITALHAPKEESEKAWRATVWFNPWMYQTGAEVWAGFAHEIIEQITSRLTRAQLERFWLELNLRRADRQAVRRRLYKVAIEKILPALLVWLVGTTAALIAGIEGVWVGLGSVSTLGAILAIGLSVVRRQPTNAAASSLVSPPDLSGLRDATSASLQGVVDEVFPDPAYESKAGFLQFVQADIRNVLDLVATPQRPLVIFVDDLDRCSPGVVAQTIEAINLFLAGQFPNVVFVLAIEPAVVAAHVEVAHRELLDRLREDPLSTNWSTLGWQFLEKIVQLPLSMPKPSPQQAEDYLSSLFARAPADGPPPPDEATMERFVKRVVDDVGDAGLEAAPRRLREVEATVIPDVSSEFAGEARRRAVAAVFEKSFKDSDPLVRRVIGDEARQLPARNAREIKRLLNLFRFYSFLAVRNRILDPSSSASIESTLRSVARLSTMAIRWPYLLNAVGRPGAQGDDPSSDGARPRILLEDLEDAALDDEAWEAALLEAGLAVQEGDPPVVRADNRTTDFREFCKVRPPIGQFARDFV